jgi:Flp pilus assembly protein TadG
MLPIVIRALHRPLRRFARRRQGNVAITFALAVIPILALVGAAIDFSRAHTMRAQLQAALDATALMVSRNAATQTGSALQASAHDIFVAQFTNPLASNLQFSASYSSSGGSTVVVSASAEMPTLFLGVLGFKTITVTGTSTSKWGSTRLRVALVLDVTGSMADDGKIGALKTATKNLLTQLRAAAPTSGDVYVSIIPFSKDVNVGTASVGASWLDWSDWEAPPSGMATTYTDSNGPGDACPFSSYSNGFTCTSGPANGSSTTSTIPSSGSYRGYICPGMDNGRVNPARNGRYYNGCYNSTQYSCTGSGCSCSGHSYCSCSGQGSGKTCRTQSGYYEHNWIKNARTTWNGCVTDRGTATPPGSAAGYDQNVTAPTTSIPATLFVADQYALCPPPMMGLSDNWTAMASFVDALTAQGSTNQPIGLVWGWQSLVGGGPLSAPALDPSYTYQQVIILLSDGLNTQNRWYGNGSTTSTSVDNRMYGATGAGTCANIKAAGITLYTIQVNTGGDPTSTLLRNCASDANKFFLLTSAGQIITTFNEIGTNLTKLRIAQ